jgi:hypothetical protein
MEASEGYVRGVVDTLVKVVAALELAGIELISENTVSAAGGRGVRLRDPAAPILRGDARGGETKSKRNKRASSLV